MVGLDQQSAPKQLIYEVPSHVVLVNNKVGATLTGSVIGMGQYHFFTDMLIFNSGDQNV